MSSIRLHYFYVCPKIFSTMFVCLRHVWCYCENSIQKLYCPSGSRAKSFCKWSILVHVCGRGFESHFCQNGFIPYIMFVYKTIYIQVLNKSGFLTYVTCFTGKISPLTIWMIRSYNNLKVAHARNFRYFEFFMVLSYCPLKTVQWSFLKV